MQAYLAVCAAALFATFLVCACAASRGPDERTRREAEIFRPKRRD